MVLLNWNFRAWWGLFHINGGTSRLSNRSLVAQMVKESACNARDLGSVPGMGRFSWRREWQPFIPVILPGEFHDRGAWWATVHGVSESDTTERLTLHCLLQTRLIALSLLSVFHFPPSTIFHPTNHSAKKPLHRHVKNPGSQTTYINGRFVGKLAEAMPAKRGSGDPSGAKALVWWSWED